MKKNYCLFFILFATINSYAQEDKGIRLFDIKLCELTIDQLKMQDSSLKKVCVEEMNLCPDNFVQDARFENGVGYSSALYPGVIFQKYPKGNIIAKLRLTKDFKGYLPDGTYIDVSILKAKDVLEKYPNFDTWYSRNCSNYWELTDSTSTYTNDHNLYFYVAINKDENHRYPIDEKYYREKAIEGIDIVLDCYRYWYWQDKIQQLNTVPLFFLDGKEINQDALQTINLKDVDSFNVLKSGSAVKKYGNKGKNGIIEIYLKGGK